MSEQETHGSSLETEAMQQERETVNRQRREETASMNVLRDQRLAIARPLIAESNLVHTDHPITEQDVETTRTLINALDPDTKNPGLHEHFDLTATFAKKIGESLMEANPEEFGQINTSELQVLGLIHDVGRLFTHRWYRNELIEQQFLSQLGIREDLLKKVPHVDMYIDRPGTDEEAEKVVEEMSLEEKIIEIADICGKRTDDGGIRSFEEIMQYHMSSRTDNAARTGQPVLYPSERKLTNDVRDLSGKVYTLLYADMKRLGADPDEIRQEILSSERA